MPDQCPEIKSKLKKLGLVIDVQRHNNRGNRFLTHMETNVTPLLPLLAALALAPAQAGELTLSEVRTTFGELGAKRSDTEFLPGDVMFIAFDIEGISIDKEGKVSYSMAMEAVDEKDKPFFRQEPVKKTDFVPFGGGKLPATSIYPYRPRPTAGQM